MVMVELGITELFVRLVKTCRNLYTLPRNRKIARGIIKTNVYAGEAFFKNVGCVD